MSIRLNNLEIKSKLPELPKTVPVFALEVPSFEQRRAPIARLAERMKLGNLRPVELDHGIVMASEFGDITHFHASGAVWARDAMATKGLTDEMRKWDGLAAQTAAAATAEGRRVAFNPEATKRLLAQTRELLEPLGLLGKEVAFESIQLDQVTQLDAKGKEIAHGAGQATVKFDYAVKGIPVRGAGAKTQAFVEPGDGSPRFAGIFHAWRGLGRDQAIKLPTSVEEALGVAFLTDPELDRYAAAGHKIRITKLELVYLALPAFTRQTHLFPAFQIEGDVSEGKLGIAFRFGRYHHAASPKAYAAADLYGSYLTTNPDGIAPLDKTRQLG